MPSNSPSNLHKLNSSGSKPSDAHPTWTVATKGPTTSTDPANPTHRRDPWVTEPSGPSSLHSPSSRASSSSAVSNPTQSSVQQFLHTLGLSEYLEIFLEEGFDRIQSIEAITEADLEYMGVKRGHRRVLQRALVTLRRSSDPSLAHVEPAYSMTPMIEPHTPPPSASDSPHDAINNPRSVSIQPNPQVVQARRYTLPCSDSTSRPPNPPLPLMPVCSWPAPTQTRPLRSPSSALPTTQPQSNHGKRKYQRHPKPDANAPEKPLSAYVMFSNEIREELKGQTISFTEMARLVGDRWKTLELEYKDDIVRRAAEAKSQWLRQMDEYKKTSEYARYQVYLKDFKQKNAQPKHRQHKTDSGPQVQRLSIGSHLESRLETDGEEDSWSESETDHHKRPRTSTSHRSSWDDLKTPLSPSRRLLSLTPISHVVPYPALRQLAPIQPFVTNTNNTFFEHRTRPMPLPADLRRMPTLAPSRESL